MRLEQLRHLICVAEAGSLRKAAGTLGISQPTLTKSLRQLEEELSASVVHRTNHGVVLTAYGRIVIARGRTALTELDRMVEEVESMRGGSSAHVRVAVSPVAAATLVPGALRQFRKGHPDVAVTIVDGLYPTVLPMIRESQIDFAIGPVPEQMLGPEFRVEQLFLSEVRIGCRRGHPLARATSLAVLQDAQWAISGPERGPGSLFEFAFRQTGVSPPPAVLCFESITSLLATARVEDLLFVMPIKILEHPFYASSMCSVPIRERIAPVPIHLLRSSHSLLPPAAEALATAMRRTRPT